MMDINTYVPSFEYTRPFCYFYTVSVGKDEAIFPLDLASKPPDKKVAFLKSNPAFSYIYSSWEHQDIVSSCIITKQRNHSDVAEITLTCSQDAAEIILKESGKGGKKLIINLGFMDNQGQELSIGYEEPISALRSVAYIGITRFPDIKLNSDGTVTLTFRSTSATPNFFTKLTTPLTRGMNYEKAISTALAPLKLHYEVVFDTTIRPLLKFPYLGPLGIPPGMSRWEFAKYIASLMGAGIFVGWLPNAGSPRMQVVVYDTTKPSRLVGEFLDKGSAEASFSTQNRVHRVSWGSLNSTRNAVEIEFSKEENAAPGSISQGDLGSSTPKTINFDAGDGEKIWVLQPKKVKAYINTHGEIAWLNFLASASDEDITKTFYESIDKLRSPSERKKVAAAGTGPSWKAKIKLFQGRPHIIPGNRVVFINTPDPSRKSSKGPNFWLVDSVVHRYDSQGFFTELDVTR